MGQSTQCWRRLAIRRALHWLFLVAVAELKHQWHATLQSALHASRPECLGLAVPLLGGFSSRAVLVMYLFADDILYLRLGHLHSLDQES